MKIGVLTGGGDCPGLNPVIRAVVRTALRENMETVGIQWGWKGLVENITMPLNLATVSGIIHRGGTILGSSPGTTWTWMAWVVKRSICLTCA